MQAFFSWPMYLRRFVQAGLPRGVIEKPRFFSSASVNKWGSLDASRSRQKTSGPKYNRTRQRLVSIEDFRESVTSFYDKVEKGVASMVKINTNMVAERSAQEDGVFIIKLGDDSEWPSLSFQVNDEERQLDYFSPVSGKLRYHFCDATETFRSIEDDHDDVGILTRDLMRAVKGAPQF